MNSTELLLQENLRLVSDLNADLRRFPDMSSQEKELLCAVRQRALDRAARFVRELLPRAGVAA
jgi:hypothetical protein